MNNKLVITIAIVVVLVVILFSFGVFDKSDESSGVETQEPVSVEEKLESIELDDDLFNAIENAVNLVG